MVVWIFRPAGQHAMSPLDLCDFGAKLYYMLCRNKYTVLVGSVLYCKSVEYNILPLLLFPQQIHMGDLDVAEVE